ncbi:threonylcarbamoyl-AMP synthase [Romeria aff. gracilis LEGE 07310]|uniref:Threonylcarbamoyl-AMP synthase n=1 Tax=Vasconcelosia minhoensis LEGE 07310 TaxID=915328 RepID=A0A8J7DN51_9CYAN|nr:L-threonylcarbamoyladenylate synthase [Romeria gracilis]MBE9077675.1 threonylcarbamoyl-AMP synthase [Romeria aff. gracilis LEGE 07310]
MTTQYRIHPQNPQPRQVEAVRATLQQGAVLLYPTDTVYAIGCDLSNQAAIKRVRQLKQLSNDKPLTFLCSSLSNIARFAQVSDPAYRLIKHLIPGPYTFLLPASREVPKLVMNPKRRTTGIRVPNNPLCLAVIKALGNPIISTSALSVARQADDEPLSKAELFDRLGSQVDGIVDTETELGYQVSTILDFTGKDPVITRQGQGWQDAIAWGASLAQS